MEDLEPGQMWGNIERKSTAVIVAVHNGNVYYEYHGPGATTHPIPMGRSMEAFKRWFDIQIE